MCPDSEEIMRRQVVTFFSSCLFLFCVIVVLWQLWQGTVRYLSTPVASKIYTEEAELPVITVCHEDDNLKIANLHKLSFYQITEDGIFMPHEPVDMTAEEVIDEAMDHYFYLLDFRGMAFDTFSSISNTLVEKRSCEIRDSQRFYVGNKSTEMMENRSCLTWSDVGIPLYESVGDHNYCRNPEKRDKQDWCFVKGKKKGFCAIETCGKT